MAGALRGPIAKPAGERDENRVSSRMKPVTAFERRRRPQPACPSSFKTPAPGRSNGDVIVRQRPCRTGERPTSPPKSEPTSLDSPRRLRSFEENRVFRGRLRTRGTIIESRSVGVRLYDSACWDSGFRRTGVRGSDDRRRRSEGNPSLEASTDPTGDCCRIAKSPGKAQSLALASRESHVAAHEQGRCIVNVRLE